MTSPLRDASAAHRVDPTVVAPYGPLIDANVELGRYAQAERLAQEAADRKPDLAVMARVSYLRELRGDRAGALRALRAALSAGGEVPESTAFVSTLIAGLELQTGDTAAARLAARRALYIFPGYPAAENALARVQAAEATSAPRSRACGRSSTALPLPEHVTLLGELELAAGQPGAARDDLALVGSSAASSAAPASSPTPRRRSSRPTTATPSPRRRGAPGVGDGAERAQRRRARMGADAQRRPARRAVGLGARLNAAGGTRWPRPTQDLPQRRQGRARRAALADRGGPWRCRPRSVAGRACAPRPRRAGRR
jgi:tetratricopeptide (TPR) repeat protein